MNDGRWSVGNEKSTNIRENKWLSIGLMGGPANEEDLQLVEELINQEGKAWNEHRLNDLLEEHMVNKTMTIPLSRNAGDDRLVWTGNKSRAYSVKSSCDNIPCRLLLSDR